MRPPLVMLQAAIYQAARSMAALVLVMAVLTCIFPLQCALPTSWGRSSSILSTDRLQSASRPNPKHSDSDSTYDPWWTNWRWHRPLQNPSDPDEPGFESRSDSQEDQNADPNSAVDFPHPLNSTTMFWFADQENPDADKSQNGTVGAGGSRSDPLVSAFFIFGDSTVDCGNNNYLGTFARANMPPYGRDFDTHMPTGRFSNGRLTVDYLALRLGLPFVPTFLGHGGSLDEMLQGVNFASAGAGIFFSSGSDLGQHISFTQQIQQASDMIGQMSIFLGRDETRDRISKSIVYISIGSNDYIHFYLRNISGIRSLRPPWEFNQLLVDAIGAELKHLYNANARKFVCIGMGPLGCAPRYLWERNSDGGECVKDINNMIIEYNFVLKHTVDELNLELPDANITFCNIYDGIMDIVQNPQLYDFETVSNACCGLGKYGGWLICISPDMACPNATTHVWWDEYHPTAIVNSLMADNIWLGKHMNICQPMNLHDLATLHP